MNRPLGLAPFARQTRLEHALTVVGAVAIFWIAYFGSVYVVYGDISVLALESSVSEQRVGGIAGGVAVWTYFALTFIRGYGGPVLNTIVYPFVIVVLAPFPARWLLFGPDVSGLIDRFIGLFVIEPFLTALFAVVPGLGVFVTILTVWASVIGETDRKAWERRHLTEEFYNEFVEIE